MFKKYLLVLFPMLVFSLSANAIEFEIGSRLSIPFQYGSGGDLNKERDTVLSYFTSNARAENALDFNLSAGVYFSAIFDKAFHLQTELSYENFSYGYNIVNKYKASDRYDFRYKMNIATAQCLAKWVVITDPEGSYSFLVGPSYSLYMGNSKYVDAISKTTYSISDQYYKPSVWGFVLGTGYTALVNRNLNFTFDLRFRSTISSFDQFPGYKNDTILSALEFGFSFGYIFLSE